MFRSALSFLLSTLLICCLGGCTSNLKPLDSSWPEAGECQVYQKSVRLWFDPSQFDENDVYTDEMKELERNNAAPDWTADESLVPIAFIVTEPQWEASQTFSDDPLMDTERKEELIFTVRERLYRYLLREYPHPVRVRYAYTKADKKLEGDRVITITSRITDATKGNGLLRYLVGYGAGRVGIQVEGDLYDGTVETGRHIGQFAIRRSHGGFAQNGFNLDVYDAHYCLRYAAEEMVTDLTNDLSEYIPALDKSEAPIVVEMVAAED